MLKATYSALFLTLMILGCTNTTPEAASEKDPPCTTVACHFQKIACGGKIREASFKRNGATGEWHFNIEVSDDINLLPSVAASADINKEVFHQLWGTFKKDTAGSWRMFFQGYRLNYYTESPDGKYGTGSYYISVMDVDKGSAWICDHCEKVNPWLKNSADIRPGWNKFANSEEAIRKIAPPNAWCIYEKIEKVVASEVLSEKD